ARLAQGRLPPRARLAGPRPAFHRDRPPCPDRGPRIHRRAARAHARLHGLALDRQGLLRQLGRRRGRQRIHLLRPARAGPSEPLVTPELGQDQGLIARTLGNARQKLLEARNAAGHWEGELSSSALSTATAVCALELVRRNRGDAPPGLIDAGLRWLARHQNAD